MAWCNICLVFEYYYGGYILTNLEVNNVTVTGFTKGGRIHPSSPGGEPHKALAKRVKNKIDGSYMIFSYLGFLSRPFKDDRTVWEGGDCLFNFMILDMPCFGIKKGIYLVYQSCITWYTNFSVLTHKIYKHI